MKKYIYLFLFFLAGLAGCKKSSFQPAFDKTPDERRGEEVSLVNTQLIASPNGWVATLPASAGGGYGFYLNFDNKGNVSMISDINSQSASTQRASTYRVIAGLGATLIFDTYNYISFLQDPNPATLGGAQGRGFSSDVEFTYVRANADSLFFTGRQFRQPLVMVKATASQKTAYLGGGLKTSIDNIKAYLAGNPNPYINIVSGSSTIQVGITLNVTNDLLTGKRVSYGVVSADKRTVDLGAGKFVFTLLGAEIIGDGLVYGNVKFTKISFKDANTLAFYDSTGKEYIVQASPTPLVPLSLLLGKTYSKVALPNATTFAGWSPDFVNRRASAANNLFNGGYSLTLENIDFTFDGNNKTIEMKIAIPQYGTRYEANLYYNYAIADDGTIKFTYTGPDNVNGPLVVTAMAPITSQRLNTNNFKMDYSTDPVTGKLLGKFTSVENPNFSFTGFLQ
ncbi:DUF4302 domain-containing protein [Pedobacter changchengzhani]|uniref:DUF4302 domain-containing protein n=1 Tax=Pedobacter changchengzhani TaxID=2529274 RepID=A0A4R5MR35_9SPHI|nr:DUF4302 domain-containing protein [Pedobacter changchengzhani]TDG38025.1 DUF4302 domain-containing protein [Pedobacter changchengzhani]